MGFPGPFLGLPRAVWWFRLYCPGLLEQQGVDVDLFLEPVRTLVRRSSSFIRLVAGELLHQLIEMAAEAPFLHLPPMRHALPPQEGSERAIIRTK